MYAFVRFLEDNVCYALPVSCVQDFSPTSQLDFDNQKVYTVYRNPEEAEEDDESPGEWGDRLLLHKAQILALAGEGRAGRAAPREKRGLGPDRGSPKCRPLPAEVGEGERGRGGGGIGPTHARSPGGTWRAGGAVRREDGDPGGEGGASLTPSRSAAGSGRPQAQVGLAGGCVPGPTEWLLPAGQWCAPV